LTPVRVVGLKTLVTVDMVVSQLVVVLSAVVRVEGENQVVVMVRLVVLLVVANLLVEVVEYQGAEVVAEVMVEEVVEEVDLEEAVENQGEVENRLGSCYIVLV
jgi:hypothetical protein